MEERISTYQGKLIRVNRSIQAEGVFAMTKEDMGFRRFLLRSAVKVEVEWTLLSLAYNVLKLHHIVIVNSTRFPLVCYWGVDFVKPFLMKKYNIIVSNLSSRTWAKPFEFDDEGVSVYNRPIVNSHYRNEESTLHGCSERYRQ